MKYLYCYNCHRKNSVVPRVLDNCVYSVCTKCGYGECEWCYGDNFDYLEKLLSKYEFSENEKLKFLSNFIKYFPSTTQLTLLEQLLFHNQIFPELILLSPLGDRILISYKGKVFEIRYVYDNYIIKHKGNKYLDVLWNELGDVINKIVYTSKINDLEYTKYLINFEKAIREVLKKLER